LEQVLRYLSEQSDQVVVLDSRLGEKGKTAVTATMLNAPLDSALFMLAEMANLRPVRLDTMYFVTSRENAEALEADWNRFLGKKRSSDVLPFLLPGGGAAM